MVGTTVFQKLLHPYVRVTCNATENREISEYRNVEPFKASARAIPHFPKILHQVIGDDSLSDQHGWVMDDQHAPNNTIDTYNLHFAHSFKTYT